MYDFSALERDIEVDMIVQRRQKPQSQMELTPSSSTRLIFNCLLYGAADEMEVIRNQSTSCIRLQGVYTRFGVSACNKRHQHSRRAAGVSNVCGPQSKHYTELCSGARR
jgi:hypothetical protein